MGLAVVGKTVCMTDGRTVGKTVGNRLGSTEGAIEGAIDGTTEGRMIGASVGNSVGASVATTPLHMTSNSMTKNNPLVRFETLFDLTVGTDETVPNPGNE